MDRGRGRERGRGRYQNQNQAWIRSQNADDALGRRGRGGVGYNFRGRGGERVQRRGEGIFWRTLEEDQAHNPNDARGGDNFLGRGRERVQGRQGYDLWRRVEEHEARNTNDARGARERGWQGDNFRGRGRERVQGRGEDDSWRRLEEHQGSTTSHVIPMVRPKEEPEADSSTLVKIITNHFPLEFDPATRLHHYEYKMSADSDPNPQHEYKLKVLKDMLKGFGYTVVTVPKHHETERVDGVCSIEEFHGLQMSKQRSGRNYIFDFKLLPDVNFDEMRNYLHNSRFADISSVWSAINAIIGEDFANHSLRVGSKYYDCEGQEIDEGFTWMSGCQSIVKPTYQGLALVLDYSGMVACKEIGVLEFLQACIPNFNTENFARHRYQVQNILKGKKVKVIHRQTERIYKVAGLSSEDTKNLYFIEEIDGQPGSEKGVVEYLEERYKKKIKELHIPCLDVSRGKKKKNYLPMEFCILVQGQMHPKRNLDVKAKKTMVENSLLQPGARCRNIKDMANFLRNRGNIISNFGMKVGREMTSVEGRIIRPPKLRICNQEAIIVDKNCSWSFKGKKVIEGKNISRWAVLYFGTPKQNQFIDKLILKCKAVGITMTSPLSLSQEIFELGKLQNFIELRQLLEDISLEVQKFSGGRLEFLLFIISGKHHGYRSLKFISEMIIGVANQCCLRKLVENPDETVLTRLALQINAKLGGCNVQVDEEFLYFKQEDHVMSIGLDVNHPVNKSRGIPSIAAAVGSLDWPASRYAARIYEQPKTSEKIMEVGCMCLELVQTYAKQNGVKPNRILIFRDGVSKSSFEWLLNEELHEIRRKIKSVDYLPTITLIVVQKRSDTRLFAQETEEGSVVNVSPGTVVDTKIVDPWLYDFYLCSHFGTLGTSRAVHYYVLLDENHLPVSELQKLIYSFCFTSTQSTSSKSLVLPIHYADCAAYRGREYYETGQIRVSSASGRGGFYRLSAGLEDSMFFI